MAPIGDKLVMGAMAENSDEDEGKNLWSTILSDVSTQSSSKLPSCKSIIVAGEDESGKTTLIAKMRGDDELKKGAGLEYFYLEVHDEDRDDHTRCGVWVMDGDSHHRGLLRFALSAENIEHTLVMLAVDMSRPWTILESLQKWADIIHHHIDRLKVPPEKMKELEEQLVRQYQEYVEPEEGAQSPQRPKAMTPGAGEEETVVLPLGEDVLTHNLGVPVVVVVTKTDAISTLEKEHDYREEHLDFIQQHIRKFCLRYGAALFYTSVKEDKNIQLLTKYLEHRLYDFPFHTPPLVVEKDAIFIPSGWDNHNKISILYENLHNMKAEDAFNDNIAKPIIRKSVGEAREVIADDEQAFLMKQQAVLSKALPAGAQRDSPQRSPMGVQRTPERRVGANVASVSPIPAGGKKLEGAKGAAGASEGVLANFFNSLLSKKTGAGGSPGAPGTPAGKSPVGPADKAVRSDAAAELDRLTRGTRKPVQGQNPQSSSAS
ncbi:cytoplasmic dynein 1 light intermediate chain 1-like isoform X2 [Branchiostoma floridae]|uniref:Dynein light intermediate chain n=1 Tax=Branchiostoma floridae TaxID=7739 RepID=A0A9J7LCY5_BRAFL|nr:cytoplasmic dynein 1 light intermediate chain 1-like isoform X2 [Branchiostoma floridae]